MTVEPVNQPNMSYQASGVLYTDCIFLFADFAFGVVCFKSPDQLALVLMFGSFVVLT